MGKIELHVLDANLALQAIFANMNNNLGGAILIDNEAIDMTRWRAAKTLLDLAYEALYEDRFATVQYLLRELHQFSFATTAVIELETALKNAQWEYEIFAERNG